MKRLFVLFFTCSLLTVTASAQVLTPVDSTLSPLKDPNTYKTSFYLITSSFVGEFGVNLGGENMRSLLQDYGIRSSRVGHSFRAGAGVRIGRVFTELRLTSPYAAEESFEGGYWVSSTLQTAGLSVGVSLWQNRNQELILKGGLGAASTNIRVQGGPGAQGFDLGQPDGSASAWPTLSHEEIFWEAGVDFVIGRPKGPTSLSEVISLGVRGGITNRPWETTGVVSTGLPQDRTLQLYMATTFFLSYNRNPR